MEAQGKRVDETAFRPSLCRLRVDFTRDLPDRAGELFGRLGA
jgi:hypothetical protein